MTNLFDKVVGTDATETTIGQLIRNSDANDIKILMFEALNVLIDKGADSDETFRIKNAIDDLAIKDMYTVPWRVVITGTATVSAINEDDAIEAVRDMWISDLISGETDGDSVLGNEVHDEDLEVETVELAT